MINKIITEIKSYDKVLILGYGREGKSTYNFIRKYLPTKKLYIADGNSKLLKMNEELNEDSNLSFELGKKYLDNLDKYDLIIKSPGVNFKYINYDSFEDKITSQIDLLLKYAKFKTIGITGTKGKSTTSALIYHILKAMGYDTLLGGNIGIPVFDRLDFATDNTIFVIELSCHQLKFIKHSPNISVLLNLYEEHLDLYKSFLDYKEAKLNIFKYQKDTDYNIWGLDSYDSNKHFIKNDNTLTFSKDETKVENGMVLKDDGLYLVKNKVSNFVYDKNRKRYLLGDHNLYNVAAALLIADLLGINLEEATRYIDNFIPLEHRMEIVGNYNGIDFYNDSIATIPDATINCINSIPNTTTVIVGGMDRKIDLSKLTNYLYESKTINTCIFLKDTGYQMYDELMKLKCSKRLIKAKDMKDAVENAFLYTDKGEACVLSPAAASYNTYKNFEERGRDFKRWVKDSNE